MLGNNLMRRGLHIDDDDKQTYEYEYQSLDANRKRGNFEKDLDEMLFGGGMPSSRRKKVQSADKKQQQPSDKPVVVDAVQPDLADRSKNQSASVNKANQSNKQASGSPKNTKKEGGMVIAVPGNPYGIGNKGAKTVTPKAAQPVSEPTSPKMIPPQPTKYQSVIFLDKIHPYPIRSDFHLPSFLRKGTKVADDYNFATLNLNQNSALDVVRPFQTDRARQRKLNILNYKDYEFPAVSSSLGIVFKGKPSVWKQPSQLAKTVSFGKYIDPNDLLPGALSSSHFVSTLSALAENEANIKRIIEDQRVNNNKFYLIRLFVNSVWRYIAVDSSLPFIDDQNAGIISCPESDFELSPALIEKAYAKIFGSYGVFGALEPRESYLRDLTGAPVRSIATDSAEFETKVTKALAAGQVVMAVPNQSITDLGLNPNISFSVLAISHKGGLSLRNNFGALQQKNKISISSDGIFQLSSSQAKEHLSHVLIAQINPNYFTSTVQARHKLGFYSTYNFTLYKDAHGFISASQWDRRFFPKSSKYDYAPLRIILQRNERDGYTTFVNGAFSFNSRNTDLQVNLVAGDYTVFVAASWQGGDQNFYLAFYGSQTVRFERIHTDQTPNLLSSSLQNLNLDTPSTSDLNKSVNSTDQNKNVSQYLSYEPSSNCVVVTLSNTTKKKQQAAVDFSGVRLHELTLLTSHNQQENYSNKVGQEIEEYKHPNTNEQWSVNLQVNCAFTWVFAVNQVTQQKDPRFWGFK